MCSLKSINLLYRCTGRAAEPPLVSKCWSVPVVKLKVKSVKCARRAKVGRGGGLGAELEEVEFLGFAGKGGEVKDLRGGSDVPHRAVTVQNQNTAILLRIG